MVLWLSKLRVLTQKYKFESNSQHDRNNGTVGQYCEFSHKNTNLKAIHNKTITILLIYSIASSHTKIQIWKQFTTLSNCLNGDASLRVLTQKYKFESNSQLTSNINTSSINCEFSHKNTNLKAIHNYECKTRNSRKIASSHTKIQIWKQFTTQLKIEMSIQELRVLTQKYKFESNSQRNTTRCKFTWHCEFSHKNTNLKAIHNDELGLIIDW